MIPTKISGGATLATNGITRVTRKGRPNYPIDVKRRLATLACEPGISVAKLALEHGINANLPFKWRRHYCTGLGRPQPEHRAVSTQRASGMPTLLPVMTESPRVS